MTPTSDERPADERPNIVLFMTDDHAVPAIGAYGSVINRTPAVDGLAAGGMRFDNTFCTNAICSPARATLLTGAYSHVNGMTSLQGPDHTFDATQPSFPEMLQAAGYQTAIIGKWHLGHGGDSDPRGFDHWEILPEHGVYHDPTFLTAEGERRYQGYVTDIITDLALGWLDKRDPGRPFALLIQHKAPHRSFEPADRHRNLYAGEEIPAPPTLHDDLRGRASAASEARLAMSDLEAHDLKEPVPEGLSEREEREWRYQRYIKDYLRVVAALDENVGRVLHWLETAGLSEGTAVAYTSDHGFFLGEHGWFDKRFMYDPAMRIPLVMRWPGVVAPGSVNEDLVANVDFAPTLLDLAGVEPPARMQGRSLLPLLRGSTPEDWRTGVYYRYYMHLDGDHHVQASYGVRTRTHKLIHYPGHGSGASGASGERREPEWELFDLAADPEELHNRYDDPEYAPVVAELKEQLAELQKQYGDTPEGVLPLERGRG
ncbi:Arylsulfatase A [Streptomyces sp. WMMB 714]|uniref:sulfatase family protein n=1 Tax=Streptomyces sp. WMMB 714 TaxID=1286822 RepID=UPI0005F7AC41|nr:sulfatase [Streptomyces sp. WMMB 714]SCK20898.1 Arylsulfatase A [Streptomyces sp. WMMB 714]